MVLSYLETVWSFRVLLLDFIQQDRCSIRLGLSFHTTEANLLKTIRYPVVYGVVHSGWWEQEKARPWVNSLMYAVSSQPQVLTCMC